MGLQDDMKTLLAMDAQAQKETFTPSHPFTPDVVAWAETKIRNYESLLAGGWLDASLSTSLKDPLFRTERGASCG